MKQFFFAVLLGLFSTIVMADMTVVQTIQTGAIMGQPAHSDTMTWAIKGSKARIDSSYSKASSIIDLDTNKVYRINDAKKEIIVMSTDLTPETKDAISKVGEDLKMDTHKTGKTETVKGYKCEEYVTTMTGPMDMTISSWVTQDIDVKQYELFQTFGLRMAKMSGADKSFFEMKGMPIKSTSKMTVMGNVIDSSTELQSISLDTILASRFDLPKDYKIVDMKDMQNRHAQKPKSNR